jgi:hypothetical protein
VAESEPTKYSAGGRSTNDPPSGRKWGMVIEEQETNGHDPQLAQQLFI